MPLNPYALMAEQERQREALPIQRLDSVDTYAAKVGYSTCRSWTSPLAASWPALNWTPEGLIERVGADTRVRFQDYRNKRADYELDKASRENEGAFRQFVIRAQATVANTCYLTAYNSAANTLAMTTLWADLRPLPFLTEGIPPFPWIGGAGTFTPLHYDLTNNLIVQVVGEKEFWIGPPSLTPEMRNEIAVFSALHDIASPRCEHEYNLQTQGEWVRLSPGDALFIPFGWWHQARSLSFSVTLTYTSFIWPNDMASRLAP